MVKSVVRVDVEVKNFILKYKKDNFLDTDNSALRALLPLKEKKKPLKGVV